MPSLEHTRYQIDYEAKGSPCEVKAASMGGSAVRHTHVSTNYEEITQESLLKEQCCKKWCFLTGFNFDSSMKCEVSSPALWGSEELTKSHRSTAILLNSKHLIASSMWKAGGVGKQRYMCLQ